jgi:hypothetical protein
MIPTMQVAGQDAVKFLATPEPVESPVITTKSHAVLPVPAPVVTRTAVKPSQVGKTEKCHTVSAVPYCSRFFVLLILHIFRFTKHFVDTLDGRNDKMKFVVLHV